MSCSCRKYAAWLSRSAKIATSTLAPVTSSRPDDCTWMTARWITRWKPAVGFESWRPSATRFSSSVSTYSTRLRRSTSRSTLQARMTAAASWSSMSASRRCSSVAYSWRRWFAAARARWRDCSRLREKDGTISSSLLFHDALQRMLVLAGEIHHLRDLRFRHLVCVDPALSHAIVVDVQHDMGRFLAPLVEKTLEYLDDELHGSVVVDEEENAIQRRTLGGRLGLRDDRSAGAVAPAGRPGLAGHDEGRDRIRGHVRIEDCHPSNRRS